MAAFLVIGLVGWSGSVPHQAATTLFGWCVAQSPRVGICWQHGPRRVAGWIKASDRWRTQRQYEVEPRDPAKNKGTGSRVSRRLRAKGLVPGVIYGHKQAVVPISLSRDDVWKLIKTPGHLTDLEVGGTNETVLIRDVQWDHLGKEIIHLDFARVSAEEVIETEVSLELKGVAPGVASGGILEHLVHSVRIKCRAERSRPRSRWMSATWRSTREFMCASWSCPRM